LAITRRCSAKLIVGTPSHRTTLISRESAGRLIPLRPVPFPFRPKCLEKGNQPFPQNSATPRHGVPLTDASSAWVRLELSRRATALAIWRHYPTALPRRVREPHAKCVKISRAGQAELAYSLGFS